MWIHSYSTHPFQRFNHAMAVANTRWTLAQGKPQVLSSPLLNNSGIHTPRYSLAPILPNQRRQSKTLWRRWWSGICCHGARQAFSRHAYHITGYAPSHLKRSTCTCRLDLITCLPDWLRQVWQRDCPDAIKRQQVDFVPFNFLTDQPVLNQDIYYVCGSYTFY